MAVGNIEINELNISLEVDDMLSKMAKDLVEELKKTSPKNTGEYAEGWTSKRIGKFEVVYNKNRGSLVHLKEYGHVVRRKKGYKRIAPQPHVYPAFQKILSNFSKYKNEVKIKY